MESKIFLIIIAVCLVLISINLIKYRPNLLANFLLRASVGTTGLYLLNMLLRSKEYNIRVGINGLTILANGLLGLPGFLMLYGLAIYYFFK